MARGFVYLTAVVDVASRKVLAHRVAITLEAIHAKEGIEQALAKYGVPEIVNTDQGSQAAAEAFTDVVLAALCKLSMDGRGAWRDNVFVERLWRSVKREAGVPEGLRQRERGPGRHRPVPGLVSNNERPHSSLERLTPDETYFAGLPQLKRVA